jgi:hypothetical protein
VDGCEFLQCLHLPESEHRPLSSSERQVAIFDPVVQPLPHFAAVEISQFTHRCRVGSQAVGDDHRWFSVPLQRLLHEGQSRGFVPFLRDVAFEDLALVIDRAPQVDHLTVQLHVHFVEVPLPVAETAHS